MTSLVIAVVAQFDLGSMSGRLAGYQVLWPQNWWFFTGLHRPTLTAYRIELGTAVLDPRDERHERVERLWGLNRIDDVRQTEVKPLARLVPGRYWQTCAQELLTSCVNGLDRSLSYRVRNPAHRPVVCGSTAVAVELAVTPDSGRLPNRPSRVVQVAFTEVECVS
ncbi:hypothetical protein [Saccharothrix algeriensis]|uniref:Uncharacterized protein n=1 Tax=Saccharothrix algeriensis TaxID=173560 RepID=A0ABS2S2K6_9PSEU|nr:hypothetical protein [Saccharothrix algeriensis]MBM7810471.1 hypothetical protein [Saccharothrix algeriensis]